MTHLAPSEIKMLKILRKVRRPTSTKDLARMYFDDREPQSVPEYGQSIVSGICRSLERKGLAERTHRRGPHAISVYLTDEGRKV